VDEKLEKLLSDSSEIDLYPDDEVDLGPIDRVETEEQFTSLMERRSSLIADQCGGRTVSLNYQALYTLQNRSLVWCPVFKAASTNWMHNLLLLSGREDVDQIIAKHPRQPNDQGREVAPKLRYADLQKILHRDETKTLLIVRHPFERLVSAFRDKLEQCHGIIENCQLEKDWYYQQYGKKIVSAYRKLAISKFGQDFFTEKQNFGAPFPVSRSWRSEKQPTWWEFVHFLLDSPSSSYDEHWRPATMYCSLCSEINYDFVIHTENMQEEEQIFVKLLGAQDVIKPRWENSNKKDLAREEIITKYFSMLDNQQILQLYEIYKDDFTMFGYQFQFRGLKLNVPQYTSRERES